MEPDMVLLRDHSEVCVCVGGGGRMTFAISGRMIAKASSAITFWWCNLYLITNQIILRRPNGKKKNQRGEYSKVEIRHNDDNNVIAETSALWTAGMKMNEDEGVRWVSALPFCF